MKSTLPRTTILAAALCAAALAAQHTRFADARVAPNGARYTEAWESRFHWKGAGAFALESGQARPIALAAGDFDGDGVRDIAALYEYSGQSFLAVYRGQSGAGAAPFAEEATVTTLPERADFLAAGDFSGSGAAEIVAAASGGHRLYYLANRGGGDFAEARAVALEGGVTALAVRAIGRGGMPDVVATVRTAEGVKHTVFSHPRGAMHARPETAAEAADVAPVASPLAIPMQFAQIPGMTYVTFAEGNPRPLVIPASFPFSYVIDDSSDGGDPNVGGPNDDGICNSPPLAPNGTPLGGCTFRSAIQNANFHGVGVNFTFATNVVNLGNGGQPIYVPAIVDGTTAPGGFVTITCSDTASGDTIYDPIAIRMDGGNPVGFIPGSPSVARLVKGFHISNCLTGIRVTNVTGMRQRADGAVIVGNRIVGRTYAPTGQPLGYGIISQSVGNTIGDPNPALTNYIRNVASGVFVSASGNFNEADGGGSRIVGNQITAVEVGVEVAGGTLLTQVGGVNPGEGNFIDAPKGSYYHFGGVEIYDTGSATFQLAQNVVVQGNKIGTDGVHAGSVNGAGVLLESSFGQIGGASAAARNYIAGVKPINGRPTAGILLNGNGNTVQGNYLGVDQTGMLALPGPGVGIELDGGQSNQIGGAGAGNLIGGFQSHGMLLGGGAAVVQGNLVGVNKNGTAAIGNGGDGIHIGQLNAGSAIGGENPGEGNILSGNAGAGLAGDFDYMTVKGNLIGVDVTATVAIPNNTGINGGGVGLPVVGGTTPAAANVIAGNTADGVVLTEGAGGMILQGNYIGTTPAGATNLGNGGNGVRLYCCGNLVSGNTIQHNGLAGVKADYQQGVRANSIFANGGLGIDFAHANFPPPTIVSANGFGGINVSGTIPTQSYLAEVEVFANQSCDPSGFGEGQTYLGKVTVPSGLNFSFSSPVSLPPGMFVTSTLQITSFPGSTATSSSFSNCVAVPVCASNATAQVTITRGGLRRDRVTGRYLQTLHIVNNGTALAAPLSLTFDSLTAGATVYQASGATSCSAPASPYLTLPAGLAQGGSADINVEFSDPSNAAIQYTNRLLSGSNR